MSDRGVVEELRDEVDRLATLTVTLCGLVPGGHAWNVSTYGSACRLYSRNLKGESPFVKRHHEENVEDDHMTTCDRCGVRKCETEES